MESEDLERVAIVCDDEQFSRTLVSSVVEQLGYVVHSCDSASETLSLAAELDPDLVVIDLDLGEGPTGIDVLRYIQADIPWVAGVILTGHRSPQLVRKDLPRTVEGVAYLVKSDLRSTKDLAEAIESAVAGTQSWPEQRGDLPRLTSAQADLLKMINDGLSNDEIAKKRECSVRSAERLVVRLYRTMGIDNHSGANARVVAARMYRDGQVTTR